jgi:hypothetical protein
MVVEGYSMSSVRQWMKGRLRKAVERDRQAERYVEAASRFLWRWREQRLLALVAIVAILDYASTYAVLELSGKRYLNEGGPLASWALGKGGFWGLLLADIAAVIGIALLATIMRFIYSRLGFKGFSRAAFVFLLLPYLIMAIVAIFNNLILAFI